MNPLIMAFLRRNAPMVTLPAALIVGFIGYKIEGLISDKHTPYSDSIQDKRSERLAAEEISHDPTKVEKLRLRENVLERNLSPSLQTK